MFSDHEIAKKIEEVNFPNVVEVEIEPGSLYTLEVNTALKTHAVFFCIDDALRSLEFKFFKGVESVMDSIVEEKIKRQERKRKMNDLYQGKTKAGLPPIQIQPPSMSSVLDMLNIINGQLCPH